MKMRPLAKGFGIGLIIGGVVALLLVPDSGKVTRAEIQYKYNELKKKLKK